MNKTRVQVFDRDTARFQFQWLTAVALLALLAVALSACGVASAAPTAVPPTSTVAPAAPTAAVAPAEVIAAPSTDVTNVDESGNTAIDQDALASGEGVGTGSGSGKSAALVNLVIELLASK